MKKAAMYILFPLIAGAVIGLLTRSGVEEFKVMEQPPFSPPGWLFPVVWTILYTLMGISSYLISISKINKTKKEQALNIYYGQLIVNLIWPFLFFNFGWYLFSFIWILFLWFLVIVMINRFSTITTTAAAINIPYLIWITFAAYLNYGIWQLN